MFVALALQMAVIASADPAASNARDALLLTEKRQREIMAQVFRLSEDIKEASRKCARLNERRSFEETSARTLNREVGDLDRRIVSRRKSLERSLRHLYMARPDVPVAMLFAVSSPVETDRTRRFLKLLARDDQRRITDYVVARRERAVRHDRLKGAVTRLNQITKKAESEAARLVGAQKQKSRLVAELERDKALRLKDLKTWRQAHFEDRPTFFETKGRLQAPLEDARGQDPQVGVFDRGRYYRAPAGQSIRAVYDGVVALATEIPGFGRTVIVDHGDSYYSVYAFARALNVKEGARITEGETLAITGMGSPLLGPGLYFELRHFTDAIDPREWIKDASKRSPK